MTSDTIVFDAITVERQNTFRFDVWYANHYLPQLLERGRFVALRRYLSPIRGTYLSIFEAGPDPLPQPLDQLAAEHELIASVERFAADSLGSRRAAGASESVLEADIVYPVFFKVPAEREREFNAWYDDEHMDILLRCPYWPACRRFRIRNAAPDGWTHLALHYLTDLRALESPERDAARATPWRDRLAAEPWFKGEYRVYYRWGASLSGAGQAGVRG